LSQIRLEPEVPGAATLYREKYRPQFHFSPRVGWNNDPNGLVYHAGEWHLYFQHNPYGWKWGNMHWGHAVSTDLVHWTELPIAIYPRRYDDWVFSGGALVDKDNTAGFKSGTEDVIIAAYTSTGRGEAIAYSHDRGRTFTEYDGNPVIRHQGRDPKIIWYAPGQHWVLAVYDEEATGGEQKQRIAFYTSDNLKQWTRQSQLDGYFECPEIFELPVDGDSARTRWVVYAANGDYQLGSFDGRTFTPDHPAKHRYNWGNCFYASQTFSDVPPDDGRRIQIAWGQIGHPDMPFNQQMNFPVELTLHTTEDGLRMFANPVREIAALHARSFQLLDAPIVPDQNPLTELGGELLHIQAEIHVGDARQIELNIRGQQLSYDAVAQTLTCLDREAPLPLQDGCLQLEILVDRLSIEFFGNGGRVYMPMGMVIDPDNTQLAIAARGGTATIRSMAVHHLNSAWRR
ncbi:MAG: glycoside hydrolase family 32 protein, partial [Pirellulaceae bacterium]|nr:glycoside hydrolase family 32 protein [Pirellulaceae bacterium]